MLLSLELVILVDSSLGASVLVAPVELLSVDSELAVAFVMVAPDDVLVNEL